MKPKDRELLESTYEKIKEGIFSSKSLSTPQPEARPVLAKAKANIEETLTHYYNGKLSLEEALGYIKIQLEKVKPLPRSDDGKMTAAGFYN